MSKTQKTQETCLENCHFSDHNPNCGEQEGEKK